MTSALGTLGEWGVRILDGLVLWWVLLWLVVGGVTAYEVRQLTSISDSAEASARAADRAGEALLALGGLPFVGDDAGELGDEVQAAADEVLANATESRTTVHRLGVLFGISVALIPLSPVLWLYLPARLAHRADVAALRRRLASAPLDPALDAYLACRAVHRLPYRDLRRLTDDPIGDLHSGRTETLARAELSRLGLQR